MRSARFVCIHGHFYQPPRENPWLGAIEQQDSAAPWHDWNERITAECYEPNSNARVLDGEGRIAAIRNNYENISFNFGPTLLAWMEARAPEVYAAILAADRRSRQRHGGHGSAMAQAYNHMILPLAHPSDLKTQVIWGIRDFEHRFGRRPEGMWLPETAANLATLEALAEAGIQFTILAPGQAQRVRSLRGRTWKDVSGGHIDPSRAYAAALPSRRRLALFFYDGPISQAVAFEGLLHDGHRFAERLNNGFSDARGWPQLVHIATDGESYGHHHRKGEMALAAALAAIGDEHRAELVNYGEFLERHPPTHEVEIRENTSWSCAHGIERWRSDCGCNSGRPGWRQQWRAPLRQALDWLRDELAPRYQAAAAELLCDPWAARDDYIELVLEPTAAARERFFTRHGLRPRGEFETGRALELLELQRHAQLMYTSCGWFFDELSGLETVQVIQYAARAIDLAAGLFGSDAAGLEAGFVDRLARARSNLAEIGDGRAVYERMVKPAAIGLTQVAADVALDALFTDAGEQSRLYGFDITRLRAERAQSGRQRLAVGHIRVTTRATLAAREMVYGVFYAGGHSFSGGVRPWRDEADFQAMAADLRAAFESADLAETVHRLDANFPNFRISLRQWLRDERSRILDTVLDEARAQGDAALRLLYDAQAPLLRFLREQKLPAPRFLRAAADEALRLKLLQAMRALQALAQLATALPFEASLRPAQNLVWDLMLLQPAHGDEWRRRFASLVDALSFHAIDIAGAEGTTDGTRNAA